VVLCVDEKSGIQPLDRSQPVLPMMPGTPERRSHDYVRHGTTDLFAASSIADGTVISQLRRHHRAAEFRKFLARIDKAVPAGLGVHLVCDNQRVHRSRSRRRTGPPQSAHTREHVLHRPVPASSARARPQPGHELLAASARRRCQHRQQ
jgi:hypothetical protein